MSIEAMKQMVEAWDDYDGGTLDHPLSSAMENLRTAIEQMDKQGGRDWSLLDEAKMFADDRPTSISDDLYQWALDAEGMLEEAKAKVIADGYAA